jgi:hypothetical protein
MSLYAPLNAIAARLEDRLQVAHELREVYTDSTLADVTVDAVLAPSIAVVPAPFVIRDVDAESGDTLLEARYQVTAITRAANDRGRATRARTDADALAVEIIRHLSAWSPGAGFGPLMLRAVPGLRESKGKVFVPLTFGAVTRIEAAA